MFLVNDRIVFGMAMLRFISCIIEFTAAVLFLKFDSIEKALQINALLALIGPSIMSAVMLLGLAGMTGKVSAGRFIIIFCGVLLIFYGVGKGR